MGIIPEPIWRPSHAQYHAERRWSSSRLKCYRESPALARRKFHDEKPLAEKRTWSLVMGSVVNAMLLRQATYKREVEVAPVDGRTAVAYKKLVELYPEKTVITQKEEEEARVIADAILKPRSGAAEVAHELLLCARAGDQAGYPEYAFKWDDESGVPCKAMLDRLRALGQRPIIAELKTSRDPAPDSFSRDVVTYGYDAQAAFNARGVRHTIGVEPAVLWVVVRNEEPYDVAVYQVSNQFRLRGAQIIERDLLALQARLDGRLPWVAEWQMVQERIPELLPPEWAMRALREGISTSLFQ